MPRIVCHDPWPLVMLSIFLSLSHILSPPFHASDWSQDLSKVSGTVAAYFVFSLVHFSVVHTMFTKEPISALHCIKAFVL